MPDSLLIIITPAPDSGTVIDIGDEIVRRRARCPDVEAQMALREKLRYKWSGRMTPMLSVIGSGIRSESGFWWWVFVSTVGLGYFASHGIRSW